MRVIKLGLLSRFKDSAGARLDVINSKVGEGENGVGGRGDVMVVNDRIYSSEGSCHGLMSQVVQGWTR